MRSTSLKTSYRSPRGSSPALRTSRSNRGVSMDKLRIGVVGAGYWGPNLIRNFGACPLTDMVAVCDMNPARLEAVGRLNRDMQRVTSVDELLKVGVDAVAIAT